MEAMPDKPFKTVSAVEDGLFRAPSHMACSSGPVPFIFRNFMGRPFCASFTFWGVFIHFPLFLLKHTAKVQTACLHSSSWQVKLPTLVSRVENEVFDFACCNHVD